MLGCGWVKVAPVTMMPSPQRDDDEQAAALGHMRAADIPFGEGRTADSRHVEKGQRPGELDCKRDQPLA